jgi:hypothetical protein
MSANNLLPRWIIEAVNQRSAVLNDQSREFFAKTLEMSSRFDQSYLSIPAKSDLGLLKSANLQDIQEHCKIDSPREFILLSVLENFHYHAVYQVRELGLSLIDALTQGRFFVAAIINRSMLEVVAINYYTFRRVERHSSDCFGLLRDIAKTKSKREKARILEKYGEKTFEIFTLLFDANAATSINWQDYLRKFGMSIAAQDVAKKLNVLTALEDLQKASKIPLDDAYKTMCEFVHPNAGSKMLVVNTRNSHDQLMYRLTIGDNKGNSEAALFYVDHMAESMYYTITRALTLFNRSQDLIQKIDALARVKSSDTCH